MRVNVFDLEPGLLEEVGDLQYMSLPLKWTDLVIGVPTRFTQVPSARIKNSQLPRRIL
ncbi:MAG: hypothetical protein H9536_14815 [Aphanizomenon flos-aquae Clear-A1]|jgi:hypothetical protein|nr:hypothetical protein [Aphanizomenon flos-aquae Clear-A1]MBO1044756.1 hypothetical protein [Aphanizomenon flos-aquae UKL13-PB]